MVRRTWLPVSCCAVLAAGVLSGCQTASSLSLTRFTSAPSPAARPESSDVTVSRELQDPVRVHVAYGRLLEERGKPGDAYAAYERALQHNPKSLEARLGLARIDAAEGKYNRAEEQLAVARRQHKDSAEVHAGYAHLHVARKQWSEAEAELREAIALDSRSTNYQYQLGVVLTSAGRIDEALLAFDRSIGRAEGCYNVAFLLQQQGDLGTSRRYLDQALALNPELKAAQQMRDRFDRSGVALASGQQPNDRRATPASYTAP